MNREQAIRAFDEGRKLWLCVRGKVDELTEDKYRIIYRQRAGILVVHLEESRHNIRYHSQILCRKSVQMIFDILDVTKTIDSCGSSLPFIYLIEATCVAVGLNVPYFPMSVDERVIFSVDEPMLIMDDAAYLKEIFPPGIENIIVQYAAKSAIEAKFRQRIDSRYFPDEK